MSDTVREPRYCCKSLKTFINDMVWVLIDANEQYVDSYEEYKQILLKDFKFCPYHGKKLENIKV